MVIHSYRLTKEGITHREYAVWRENADKYFYGDIFEVKKCDLNVYRNGNFYLTDSRDDEYVRSLFKKCVAKKCSDKVAALKREQEQEYDKYLEKIDLINKEIVDK